MELLPEFNSLTSDYILTEGHVHSTWTDGTNTLAELAEEAEQIGLKRLFFTEHIRSMSTYYEDYLKEVARIAKSSKIKIQVGFESKIADYQGSLDIPDIAAAKADIIIGTVHSVPTKDGLKHPKTMERGDLEKAEYELATSMLNARTADVLGHAGGMSLSIFGKFDFDLLEKLIAKCAETGVAFEINSRYHAQILDWLWNKLEHYNPKISLASDAHSLKEIGNCSKMILKKQLFPQCSPCGDRWSVIGNR